MPMTKVYGGIHNQLMVIKPRKRAKFLIIFYPKSFRSDFYTKVFGAAWLLKKGNSVLLDTLFVQKECIGNSKGFLVS